MMLRRRRYIHIDQPVHPDNFAWLGSDNQRVVSWSWLPFIQFDIATSKVRKVRSADGESLVSKIKTRPIMYAGHRDAAVLEYYGTVLAARYERWLESSGLAGVPTAFRRREIPLSNIEYAKEAFDFVASLGEGRVLTFDVTQFFDRLDHTLLKRAWASLLGSAELPPDHYAVFRAITRYCFVRRDELIAIVPDYRKRRQFWMPGLLDALRGSGRLMRNGEPRGIPQGSPISAVLSNIYMMSFDARVTREANELGCFYRRYCDDIIIAGPTSGASKLESVIQEAMADHQLELSVEKSTKHEVLRESIVPPVKYLGFIFDGSRVFLRPSGIKRYYSKMRRAVGRAAIDRGRFDAIAGRVTYASGQPI